jgi:hypothetical protein
MFCPQCGTEYRLGSSRCSDCDVDLVHELPQELADEEESRRIIWEGDDESDCLEVCRQLKDADLYYRVDRFEKYRTTGMTVYWDYKISIPASSYEKARNVLGIDEKYAEDEPSFELPAATTLANDLRVGSDSYLKKWNPENATIEVWTQKAADTSSIVELSLKGNLIRFRSERREDGTRKFFVLPEDESRAREIVREIEEGVPPE